MFHTYTNLEAWLVRWVQLYKIIAMNPITHNFVIFFNLGLGLMQCKYAKGGQK